MAAASQAAALRAWGTHQNLFAEGRAAVTEDPAAVEAAMANPNLPLRRALGATGPFEVEPRATPVLPDLPKAKGRGKTTAGPTRSRPRPDRSRLDAAERALRDLDAAWKRQEADYEAHITALQRELDSLKRTHERRRMKAVAAVSAARQAYRDAGGDAD